MGFFGGGDDLHGTVCAAAAGLQWLAVVPDASLSAYAAELLRVLTVPEAADDPIGREAVDESRLTDRELGVLLPAACRLPGLHPASLVRMAVEDAGRVRQPVFTPESCAAMLSALVSPITILASLYFILGDIDR